LLSVEYIVITRGLVEKTSTLYKFITIFGIPVPI
jgi:hypothetical protein